MKPLLIGGVLFLVAWPVDAGADEPTNKLVVKATDLSSGSIVGRLGVPLGRPVRVQATVIKGPPDNKVLARRYLLRVVKVSGQRLTRAIDIPFEVAPAGRVTEESIGLARDWFALHKLKTGRDAKSITSNEIAVLEEEYVGRSVALDVYEHGVFSGHIYYSPPAAAVEELAATEGIEAEGSGLPVFSGDLDLPFRAGSSYHFRTHLVVLFRHPSPSLGSRHL